MTRWYLVTLLAANLTLFLPPASPLRVSGALLLIGLLPGLSWCAARRTGFPPLSTWLTAAALSYVFTMVSTLLLHYLPGPVLAWHLLIALNGLALLPFLLKQRQSRQTPQSIPPAPFPWPLLIIFAAAIFLRAANLHYSEFQGDEGLAMLSAAEALAGHENALFLRSKGPGEVLLPMALWRLTGIINEPAARLPFTIAALLAILTIYLVGARLSNSRAGWLAAGFFAFNGFMVAFGRIVQYQALVVWMSAMAFWLTLRWRRTGQTRFILLAGLCLGAGLLAHYDAVLALPAIGWLLIGDKAVLKIRTAPRFGNNAHQAAPGKSLAGIARAALIFLAAALGVSLPFYLPFIFDPQAGRTGDYVSGRIGSELRNNLPDFFHFNTFYSSSYYLILTGILVLGALAWLVWQTAPRYRWVALPLVAGVLGVVFAPSLLVTEGVNLSALPFGLLLLAAFAAIPRGQVAAGNNKRPAQLRSSLSAVEGQALVAWLAVPFLGYNFVVALGLTHIYTVVPAWALLSGLGWYWLVDPPDRAASGLRRGGSTRRIVGSAALSALALLSTIFLWNAFVRTDVEYVQDYPRSRLPLFWTPYVDLPRAGFFGFPHRAGWKAVGQKIAVNELHGDYGSNEEPDVTAWYTRAAPRACDDTPEFYFLADDLVDAVEIPADIIDARYEEVGRVTLVNGKRLRVMQLAPASLQLTMDEPALARAFDRSATPEAFARSWEAAAPAEANFGNIIRLIGYDLDTRRAYPGGRVPVTLYWQALAPIPRAYQVFVHLEGDSGPVAQANGAPVCWSYPTNLWRPGQVIADQHAIRIAPDTPPGRYPLEVGFFLPDTFERLEILDVAGNPAGVSVRLAEVEIGGMGSGD